MTGWHGAWGCPGEPCRRVRCEVRCGMYLISSQESWPDLKLSDVACWLPVVRDHWAVDQLGLVAPFQRQWSISVLEQSRANHRQIIYYYHLPTSYIKISTSVTFVTEALSYYLPVTECQQFRSMSSIPYSYQIGNLYNILIVSLQKVWNYISDRQVQTDL